jgi:3-oxoacyl-[acyl-carrier-protein] synthase III
MCTGFVYGMVTASQFIHTGTYIAHYCYCYVILTHHSYLCQSINTQHNIYTGAYKKVVVVGADALTRFIDWKDRGIVCLVI